MRVDTTLRLTALVVIGLTVRASSVHADSDCPKADQDRIKNSAKAFEDEINSYTLIYDYLDENEHAGFDCKNVSHDQKVCGALKYVVDCIDKLNISDEACKKWTATLFNDTMYPIEVEDKGSGTHCNMDHLVEACPGTKDKFDRICGIKPSVSQAASKQTVNTDSKTTNVTATATLKLTINSTSTNSNKLHKENVSIASKPDEPDTKKMTNTVVKAQATLNVSHKSKTNPVSPAKHHDSSEEKTPVAVSTKTNNITQTVVRAKVTVDVSHKMTAENYIERAPKVKKTDIDTPEQSIIISASKPEATESTIAKNKEGTAQMSANKHAFKMLANIAKMFPQVMKNVSGVAAMKNGAAKANSESQNQTSVKVDASQKQVGVKQGKSYYTVHETCPHHSDPNKWTKCLDSVQCVARDHMCDGEVHCHDGSDESPLLCELRENLHNEATHVTKLQNEIKRLREKNSDESFNIWRRIYRNQNALKIYKSAILNTFGSKIDELGIRLQNLTARYSRNTVKNSKALTKLESSLNDFISRFNADKKVVNGNVKKLEGKVELVKSLLSDEEVEISKLFHDFETELKALHETDILIEEDQHEQSHSLEKAYTTLEQFQMKIAKHKSKITKKLETKIAEINNKLTLTAEDHKEVAKLKNTIKVLGTATQQALESQLKTEQEFHDEVNAAHQLMDNNMRSDEEKIKEMELEHVDTDEHVKHLDQGMSVMLTGFDGTKKRLDDWRKEHAMLMSARARNTDLNTD